jgi:hypothetical protein
MEALARTGNAAAPRTPRYRVEALMGYLMMSPTLAALLAFVLLPSLYVIGLSLFSWNLIANSPQFVGLRNYDELWRDGQWWQSLIQTILFGVLTVPATTAGGFLVAWALHGLLRGRLGMAVDRLKGYYAQNPLASVPVSDADHAVNPPSVLAWPQASAAILVELIAAIQGRKGIDTNRDTNPDLGLPSRWCQLNFASTTNPYRT